MMSKTETMIDSRTASTHWRLVAALAMIALVAATGGHADDLGQTEKEKKMTKTESGLQYRDIKEGTGEKPKKGQICVMHYTGWLWENGAKGKKFDSSVDRGEPFDFPIGTGRVIKGWDEGVLSMKVGGKRSFLIPPNLGYGSRGAGRIVPQRHPPVRGRTAQDSGLSQPLSSRQWAAASCLCPLLSAIAPRYFREKNSIRYNSPQQPRTRVDRSG